MRPDDISKSVYNVYFIILFLHSRHNFKKAGLSYQFLLLDIEYDAFELHLVGKGHIIQAILIRLPAADQKERSRT